MRVAVLSDIHGNAVALDACLDDLHALGGADKIVAAGDLCFDGPRPRKVLKRLQQIGAQLVRGNTDRMIALDDPQQYDASERAAILWYREVLGERRMRRLAEAPSSYVVGDGPAGLYICHATPQSDEERVWPDAPDPQLERIVAPIAQRTLVFGHLHVPYVRPWRDRMFVNVASVGLPKDGDPRAHYVLFVHRPGGWLVRSRRVDFNVKKVERQLRTCGIPHAQERIATLRRGRYKRLSEHLL
jgi:predicted phosphodiesterase